MTLHKPTSIYILKALLPIVYYTTFQLSTTAASSRNPKSGLLLGMKPAAGEKKNLFVLGKSKTFSTICFLPPNADVGGGDAFAIASGNFPLRRKLIESNMAWWRDAKAF